MATHLIIFFRTKQVHTFTIFFTKNSNSEKKILHARHQNLLRAENRKKIILKQLFWQVNFRRGFLRAQRELGAQILVAEASLPIFLKK